ncbi:Ail/Lom family outer membrane beta-barrel protein [Vibrio sp. NTOU-M3]|uniref:Ail/Lom family outer membrane beta-barrel protein n=1 Tax=Vibrio sp. NTOU-M3 TaxID=3234954 RepID=UPI00349F5E8E
MKKLTTLAALLATSFAAQAADHSVMLGYAATDIKHAEDVLGGFTLKYRYDGANRLGFLVSATITADEDVAYGVQFQPDINVVETAKTTRSYASLHVGPTYRFNDIVSAYATLGYSEYIIENEARGRTTSKIEDENFAGGAGLEFNVTRGFVINTGFEYSEHLADARALTYSVALGYRF